MNSPNIVFYSGIMFLLIIFASFMASDTGTVSAETTDMLNMRDRSVDAVPGTSLMSSSALTGGTVIWSYDFTDPGDRIHACCVRSIRDVNEDGYMDVIVALDDVPTGAPDIYCLSGKSSGTATVLWSFVATRGLSGGSGYGDYCVDTIGDLNNDGKDDVLFGTSWGGRTVYGLSGSDGSELWYYDTYTHSPDGWIQSVAAIPDVNGDRKPDALATGQTSYRTYCFNGQSLGDAELLWQFETGNYNSAYIAVPIEDMNGDTFPEALLGYGDSYSGDEVYCVQGNSTTTSVSVLWSLNTDASIWTLTAINDVNKDGKQDAVIGTYTGSTPKVLCVDGDSVGTGTILWTYNATEYIMQVRSIPDVNSDRIDDVLVGSWDNAIICLDGATGTEIWNTPTGTLNGGDVWTIAPIKDLDGDTVYDVIAGSFDTNVYCCSGKDGSVLWNFNTSRRLKSVYSIGDVDDDGCDDAIAGTQGLSGVATVYCISAGVSCSSVTPTPRPTPQIPAHSPMNYFIIGIMLGILIILSQKYR